ncbi:MAG: hypothetical protein HYY35_11165 [Deltaproteobacteria bacterium]|nr:hypothetical protein [Deltaproteobacteria bacterium]
MPAAEYPRLDATGFVRLESALSLDGRNPNNRGIDDTGHTVNLARSFAQLELIYDRSAALRLYGKFRVMTEQAADLDRSLRDFDGCPAGFRGDGWRLRVSSEHVCAEAWELYADVSIRGAWLRIGKQQVVWGETLGRRVLDVVNPLDLTWHLFLEPFSEEFDNIRVPQWMLRVTAPLANRWSEETVLEIIANPGDSISTQLPAPGSPYNPLPSFVAVDDEPARGHWTVGGRLSENVLGASLSAVALSKPVDDGVLRSRGAAVDRILGLPTVVAPGNTLPLRFANQGVHPRVFLAGGSANYFARALGAVLRLEAAFAPDQPYQKAPAPGEQAPTHVRRRATWRYALSVDRPTILFPGADATTILSLTFFETVVAGAPRGIRAGGARVNQTAEQLTFALSQGVWRKLLFLELLANYDPDGAYWLQPGARATVGDRWRVDLFANLLGGGEKRPGRLGALGFADEVVLRGSYGF